MSREDRLHTSRLTAVIAELAAKVPEWRPVTEPSRRRHSRAEQDLARLLASAASGDSEVIALRTACLAGIRELNCGALGRCLNVLDVALAAIDRSRIDPPSKNQAIVDAMAQIDMGRLQKMAREPHKRLRLRELLQWFEPFGAEALLRKLASDESRLRRRFMLDLLRVHGTAVRSAALKLLAERSSGLPWYFKRNLVHLLRTIPEPSPAEDEVAIVIALLEEGGAAPLLRETIRYLGEAQQPAAVRSLLRIGTENGRTKPSSAEDREAAVLALTQLVHCSHPKARTAAIEYLLERADTSDAHREALEGLGRSWLPSDVARDILASVERTCGLNGSRGRRLRPRAKAPLLAAQLRALRSTPSREFDVLLTRLREERRTSKLVGAIDLAPARVESIKKSSDSLAGTFGAFDLLEVLARFQTDETSGTLILLSEARHRRVELALRSGRVVAARYQGPDIALDEALPVIASCLQIPWSGSFEFEHGAPPRSSASEAETLQSLIDSALDRSLHFMELRDRIPDSLRLTPQMDRPPIPEHEDDPLMAHHAWCAVEAAGTVRGCQRLLRIEPLRLRRLLANWLETGALISTAAEGQGEAACS